MANMNSRRNNPAASITFIIVIGVVLIAAMIFRFNVVESLEITKRIEACAQAGGSYVKVSNWTGVAWECHGKDYKGE